MKTCGGSSTKNRSSDDPKVVASTSKLVRREPSLSLPPAVQVVASSVATEATTPFYPSVPKGMRRKARAIKPLKDLSYLNSLETLLSGPNSPLPKSPLSLPSKMMGSPICYNFKGCCNSHQTTCQINPCCNTLITTHKPKAICFKRQNEREDRGLSLKVFS